MSTSYKISLIKSELMNRYKVSSKNVTNEALNYAKITDYSAYFLRRKNFLNGLQNALNILNGLEQCLHKSSEYEKRLLRCKSSHPHAHIFNDLWESEPSEEKETKISNTGNTKSSRSQVDLVESWSTMSIVCLQYQYEELSKRYEALLRAYEERCAALNDRNETIIRLKRRKVATRAQLVSAHEALLAVGERYLVLRRKRLIQKKWYEEKIEGLKRLVKDVTAEAERTRSELDDQLNETMATEHEANSDLLVSEICKYNSLFLENLHLKAEMEGTMSRNTTLEEY